MLKIHAFRKSHLLAFLLMTLLWVSPVWAQETVDASEADSTLELSLPDITDPNYFDSDLTIADEFEQEEEKTDIADNLESASERVYSQFTGVLDRVRKRQRNANSPLMKIYNAHKPLTDEEILLRYSAMEFDLEDKNPYGQVNKAVREEAVATVGEMITGELTAFQAFKRGLDFSLDFGSMFGSSKSKAKKVNLRHDPIKYGLVLRDIELPEETFAVAAYTSLEEEWAYASKAKPVWDVEPVQRQGTTNPLRVNIDESRYDMNQEYQSYYANDDDIPFNLYNAATKLKAPSGKITGNIKPRNFRNAQSLAGGAIPPMQLSISQSESLYSMNYLTKADLEKEKVTHVFRAPIYKRFGLKRIHNEEFEAVETIYENILVGERMPSLSVHYRNLEERYLARFTYKRDETELSISAETPPKFDFGKDFGTKDGEKYKIDYRIKF